MLLELDGSKARNDAADFEFSDERQHTDGHTYKQWIMEYSSGLVRRLENGDWQNVFEVSAEEQTSAGDEKLLELYYAFDDIVMGVGDSSIWWWDERVYIDAEDVWHSIDPPYD